MPINNFDNNNLMKKNNVFINCDLIINLLAFKKSCFNLNYFELKLTYCTVNTLNWPLINYDYKLKD
jgi:hypothetical protein